METIKLEETEIYGAVLSREVGGSGTAVVTLTLNVDDEGVWYDSSVRYHQSQAEYFEV